MSVRSIVVALVAWMCLPLTPMAHANTIGPACWRLGNDETYRLYFMLDPANPVTASVVGQAVATGFGALPCERRGHRVQRHPERQYGAHRRARGDGHYRFLRAGRFRVRPDLTGQAVCQLANGEAGGCGMGPRAWTPVCP